jgi:membrane-bound lytic murein transglycosylase D
MLAAVMAWQMASVAQGAPARGAAKPGASNGKSKAPPPGEESLSQRRAVRGTPVEEGVESAELMELRRFEERAFPRAGLGTTPVPDADSAVEPPSVLPGRWDGSGDVPEALRSPDAAAGPRPAPTPDSEWLRSLRLPEIPVRWDPQVLRYLDYFKNDTRGRSVMSNWVRRAGRFRALFEGVLEREGLPKDLFYVAMVESGFESAARSPVGAGGIWQFMPSAARAYGLEVGYWVDARRDPERSVEAAARYLKDLFVRFGSWHLVFAAYNAGYGAVLKSIARYNTNDFWELCHHEAGLPWESSLYVPKILAAAIVGHNLQAFGFADVVPDPPYVVDRVEVPPGTGLAAVARAVRAQPQVLAALNPQLLRDRTPPDRGKYELRLPPGTAPLFAEGFERQHAPADRVETVTLRFGETLEDVAKARGTTTRELRRLNGVKDSSELRAGLAIVVPIKPARAADKSRDKASGGVVAAGGEADAERDGAGSSAEEEQTLVAVPDRVFNYEGRDRVFYRTRDGDSLEDIAEALGVRPDDLVEWNNLDPSARIHPRMVLQAFVRKDFDPTQIVLLDPASVRVVTLGSEEFLQLEAARRGKKRLIIEAKAGDTLARMGRRYGLTVGDLARINRFSHKTDLQSGQKVVVYSPVGEGAREIARGMASEPRRDRGAGKRDSADGDAAPSPGDKADNKVDKKAALAAGDRGVRSTARTGKTSDRSVAAAATGGKAGVRGVVASASGDKDRGDEKTRAKTTAAKAVTSKPAPKKK